MGQRTAANLGKTILQDTVKTEKRSRKRWEDMKERIGMDIASTSCTDEKIEAERDCATGTCSNISFIHHFI